MGVRRRGRECALQVLYQLEASADPPPPEAVGESMIQRGPLLADVDEKRVDEALAMFVENFEAPDKVHRHTSQLVRGVVKNAAAIGEKIQAHSPSWRLERMAMVDRNVLRLAVFEMLFGEDMPVKVVIDEAIEVARRYGSERSAAFVNGVLDSLGQAEGQIKR